MKCSKRGCQKPAVVYQKYSGLHLCEEHLVEDVERRAKKEMRKRLMVERGDRIAVALSGGKDSSALLHLLKKIFKSRSDLKFFAVAVDEGIGGKGFEGFRAATLRNAEAVAKREGVPLYTFSFEQEFGFSVDEVAARGFEQAPCTFCGVLRRRILETKARELEATKVATAHNLDDEAQTVLINFVRGDWVRLARLEGGGGGKRRRAEFVPRIKPLRSVPEKEVALYALAVGLPLVSLVSAHCPYAARSFRHTAKKMLNEFERRHPGTKFSLVRGYERLSEFLPTAAAEQQPSKRLLRCVRCGEASASRICKACEIVERMK
ncbi:MAG: TIGR00269 family protein [Candidatus Methanophagaceae archaeon]|nr:MAG: TIGR00269 family protein [Methanophagales archaeon]HDN68752.1 TIGR00269 family protein [Methanomicrobia archaeon]